MKKNLLSVIAMTSVIALSSAAYAADNSSNVNSNVKYKDNGGYETSSSTQRTGSDGTTRSSERNVDVDSDGRISSSDVSRSTTDPKGLMNEKSENSKTYIEKKDRGGYKQTTIREGKDAAGTNVTYKTVTDVDVDSRGNVTTTATTEKTVDPKGLMNQKTTTNKTKTVNGRVVEQTRDPS